MRANKNAVDTSASTISESVAETKTRKERKASFEEVGLEMLSSAAVGLPLAESLATILALTMSSFVSPSFLATETHLVDKMRIPCSRQYASASCFVMASPTLKESSALIT